jgi:hypothetical protein
MKKLMLCLVAMFTLSLFTIGCGEPAKTPAKKDAAPAAGAKTEPAKDAPKADAPKGDEKK